MARRRKDAPVELTDRHDLTAGLIDALACPGGKTQAFLRDTEAPGLRVRVTAAGAKSYVFESKLNRQTIRRTIGDVRNWTIEKARAEARRMAVLVDSGTDPRDLERQQRAAKDAETATLTLTVAGVWPRYMAEGKPKRKAAWKPRYVADLNAAASLGGEPKKRGKGKTKPGHLAALMALPLASIDQDTIRDWYAREAKTAPIQAARAVAMFSGFLGWCATKKDLRALVLTGARREELAGLRWADVDFQWQKLTIADKVEATRVIPLTPYMAQLLAGLPRAMLKDGTPNPYIFASSMSASGRLAEPRAPHANVLADAGIPHVSIHGLRRTFSLLGEAAGAPAGAIAQVMGHKPSAIAEGYRPRSIDALRPYLAQIECFILDKAGIAFDPTSASTGGLRLVAAAG